MNPISKLGPLTQTSRLLVKPLPNSVYDRKIATFATAILISIAPFAVLRAINYVERQTYNAWKSNNTWHSNGESDQSKICPFDTTPSTPSTPSKIDMISKQEKVAKKRAPISTISSPPKSNYSKTKQVVKESSPNVVEVPNKLLSSENLFDFIWENIKREDFERVFNIPLEKEPLATHQQEPTTMEDFESLSLPQRFQFIKYSAAKGNLHNIHFLTERQSKKEKARKEYHEPGDRIIKNLNLTPRKGGDGVFGREAIIRKLLNMLEPGKKINPVVRDLIYQREILIQISISFIMICCASEERTLLFRCKIGLALLVLF
jgi:hypothetical protein